MLMANSSVSLHCLSEMKYLSSLNDRFASYASKVHNLLEQSKRNENATIIAHTQSLESEILDLKAVYECELDNLRCQLDKVSSEKNANDLQANKQTKIIADLENRLIEGTNSHKRLENALADAQRALKDKDSVIQDLRLSIAQHQSSHIDATKDLDSLRLTLANVQALHDREATTRADMQSSLDKLTDQISFERGLHEQELAKLQNRIHDAEVSIKIAEGQLCKHDAIDESLAKTLAGVRMQCHNELVLYKKEVEQTYEANLESIKIEHQLETRSLVQAKEENNQLKSYIDDLKAKVYKLEGMCNSLEKQTESLKHTLEVERNDSTNVIRGLETKLRELQEKLNNKTLQLKNAYSANIPVHLEIEALASLLDAEESRLMNASSSQSPDISRAFPHRTAFVSPDRPATQASAASYAAHNRYRKPMLDRPRSTPATLHPITSQKTSRPVRSSTPIGITSKLPSPQKWSYVPNCIEENAGHTGNVCILEVHPDGKYLRILNTSSLQDEDVGGFILQQSSGTRPLSVFRFPPRTRIRPGSHVTVWSASSMAKNNPPHDFLDQDRDKWMSGPDCTTMLCKPNGQVVAWTTSSYPYGCPEYLETRKEPHPVVCAQERSVGKSQIMKPHEQPPVTPTHPQPLVLGTGQEREDWQSQPVQASSQPVSPTRSGGMITAGLARSPFENAVKQLSVAAVSPKFAASSRTNDLGKQQKVGRTFGVVY